MMGRALAILHVDCEESEPAWYFQLESRHGSSCECGSVEARVFCLADFFPYSTKIYTIRNQRIKSVQLVIPQ